MLRLLTPTEARADWEWIRRGLIEVRRRARDYWTPEDVYIAIASNTAQIFVLERDAAEIGFAVVRRIDDADGAVLFVWALYAERGTAAPHVNEWLCEMDALGRSIGAKCLRMASPRKGWARFFKPVQMIYEREL